ncbi:beta-lactamase superfamily II metal-dependent hydrolase [Streptohalobacillus salinus]|uniref:Beta-lactamase superfamily II metal-dependent hydrolase n=1 Tax=Streptohalobacillus salinus TaxID=621096 RepID=A0A2V3WH06_9BACI|nr:MBL fold metallo-hydrolase [Streptohalobacillus salinus]PXW92737.1 beta-lactamase superfamily II metal-dependent hydrolase [Streptohalobacillus salinus]
MKKHFLIIIVVILTLVGCGTTPATSNEQEVTSNREDIKTYNENVERNDQERNTEDNENVITNDALERDETQRIEDDAQQENPDRLDVKPMQVHFIDVGQGDATLIKSGTHTILFDAGNWNNRDAIDYIHNLGITQLDLVIASHPDADHIGQLPLIFNELVVDEVWMNGVESTSRTFERTIELILEKDINYHEPNVGEEALLGDMTIQIVAPVNRKNDANEDSLAIKLSHGAINVLLTGDAGVASEQAMIEHFDVESEFLQLGHHGSNTSTSLAFLQAVQPEVVVISVGANNSYGHPHPDVLHRLGEVGTDVYLTSKHGTVVFSSTGESYQLVSVDNKASTEVNSGEIKQEEVTENQPAKQISPSDDAGKANEVGADCIDINQAPLTALTAIKHIGEVRAEALVNLRPFQSVDELTRISGIGPSRLKDIKAENKACVR